MFVEMFRCYCCSFLKLYLDIVIYLKFNLYYSIKKLFYMLILILYFKYMQRKYIISLHLTCYLNMLFVSLYPIIKIRIDYNPTYSTLSVYMECRCMHTSVSNCKICCDTINTPEKSTSDTYVKISDVVCSYH